MKNKKLLGYFPVDSGQIMICDPCYIDSEWEKKEAKEPFNDYGQFSYAGAVSTTLRPLGIKDKNKGQLYFKNGVEAGVVSGNFGGDGCYPVYGIYGEGNELKKIEIIFN